MSGEPISPATVEKRASMSVWVPGWRTAALVYRLMSPVISRVPKAPDPLACTLRSGTRSRLKCAICSMKWWSCSRIGPSGPIVRLLRSLGAGAPVPVVEPSCVIAELLWFGAPMLPLRGPAALASSGEVGGPCHCVSFLPGSWGQALACAGGLGA